jgi:hypothetical protein
LLENHLVQTSFLPAQPTTYFFTLLVVCQAEEEKKSSCQFLFFSMKRHVLCVHQKKRKNSQIEQLFDFDLEKKNQEKKREQISFRMARAGSQQQRFGLADALFSCRRRCRRLCEAAIV